MVKLRGIEISIISQFDIQRLPEFPFHQTSPTPILSCETYKAFTTINRGIASCYVPIYHGSQIWFEYAVEGPHPPNAAYLFKLLLDGKPIVNWDCTAKHEYHGKMMYKLSCEDRDEDTGDVKVLRHAMYFPSDLDNEPQLHEFKDVIEIRVHRIEHRKRIRPVEQLLGYVSPGNKNEQSLQFHNGGYLEPGFPRRLYKYQLLDPLDEPYATFCFYYRNNDFLSRYGILGSDKSTFASSISSGEWHESPSVAVPAKHENTPEENTAPSTIPSSSTNLTASLESRKANLGSTSCQERMGQEKRRSDIESCLVPSDSDDSLSIVTKDSVEDLHSAVPRSPQPVDNRWMYDDKNLHRDVPPSPSLSPRRRLKKRLAVNLSGAELDLQREQRPLSPFTGTRLRKLISPSTPHAVTEIGLSDEMEGRPAPYKDSRSISQEDIFRRTARKEKGGRTFGGFLGKRFASK